MGKEIKWRALAHYIRIRLKTCGGSAKEN